jgi:NAD(P)-dependent dehydrogenase (short-subunit alcohol dehydrogenase family)
MSISGKNVIVTGATSGTTQCKTTINNHEHKESTTTTRIMSLSGKNVIVTGATSGFGVEIAKVLTEAGASVFIGGRRTEQGQQVAKETRSTFHSVDVANDESNKAFFEAAEKHFGGPNVDYILLNAGVEGKNEDTVITHFNIENYDYIFSVNVRGTLLGLKYGSQLLRQNGTFLVTSSIVSILAMSVSPIYVSSKAALDSLVRSYAAQFAESEDERIKSLSILSINPTVYETDMGDRFTGGSQDVLKGIAKMVNPSQRPGKANELAKIVKELVQEELSYKSGDVFVADADTHFPIAEYMTRMENVVA